GAGAHRPPGLARDRGGPVRGDRLSLPLSGTRSPPVASPRCGLPGARSAVLALLRRAIPGALERGPAASGVLPDLFVGKIVTVVVGAGTSIPFLRMVSAKGATAQAGPRPASSRRRRSLRALRWSVQYTNPVSAPPRCAPCPMGNRLSPTICATRPQTSRATKASAAAIAGSG